MLSSAMIALPILLVGGTEIQTLNLVRVLINAEYQVTVCCYYEFDTSMVTEIERAGANVILMKLKRADGALSLIIKLKRLFKELNPDIVHVQYIAPGLVPIIAARLAGIRTIFATVHQPGRTYGWKEKLLLRTAAKLCTAFFCNSRAVEESWFGDSEVFDPNKNYKNRKHFTIYNGVDINNIEQVIKGTDPLKIRNKLGLHDKSVIGVVGRLRWEKGQDFLLDAMPMVIRDVPNMMLLIVGDGPDKVKLKIKAEQLGIAANIIWMGQLEYDEVIKLYTVMDVAAVPSRFEGFGFSAAEAMAAGVPVVASAVDGLTEIIKEGVTGYTVSVNDTSKLAKALIQMLKNKTKGEAMVQNGTKYVRTNFSMAHFGETTIAAYRYLRKEVRISN